ncbi:unnamed protein product [Effrenium voratum]|uniref:Protein kinase domain-containing protein n=1 Tax=Effrenium voratum TaxID=2562239 RepID=A0AA36NE89_9DINO|nr:unnamed protein product [Effrenium voratum]
MSPKLSAQLSEKGLTCIQPVLENLGILTSHGLAHLSAEEFSETCHRLRGAHFGPGHVAALRVLRTQQADAAPEAPGAGAKDFALSPKLRKVLAGAGLSRTEAVLSQCGVRTCACLAGLTEVEETCLALQAGGFDLSSVQAFRSLCDREKAALQGPAPEEPERPWKCRRTRALHALARLQSWGQLDGLDEDGSATPAPLKPATPTTTPKKRPGDVEEKQRLTRQRIEDTLCHSKAIQAEVVKYRDRVTGKMAEARVPKSVMALLRLRASCNGKPLSDARLARMAVDVMEEHSFDPVRAVASLSPASLLCPSGALRVLGSGFIGVVFLEEETGEVAKVMLDDFAKKEYELCRAFASANLAPAPLSLSGPCSVPGGDLYCIRMERISLTLHGLLNAKTWRGLRHGLAPPEEPHARRIAGAIVASLQRMYDSGLVHGDLHLHNIGVKDADTSPTVQFIDFGRSASKSFCKGPCAEAFRAGHEYDVCRFIGELFQAFDELQYEFEETMQECQKELKELRKSKETDAPVTDWQLHHARQLAGLQAFVDEEPKGLAKAELAYSTLLAAVLYYATVKLDLSDGFGSTASVRNRRLRQACKKREAACHKVYFKSELFWGDES